MKKKPRRNIRRTPLSAKRWLAIWPWQSKRRRPLLHWQTAEQARHSRRLPSGWQAIPRKPQRLAADLGKRFPEDTIVQFNYLPMIRAAIALRSGDGERAIEALAASVPYELGQTNNSFTFALYPVYLRGEAYLAAKQGAAAATEFQKILDHAGVVGNEPIGALAHLGLGRAYALSGDTAKAKAAYQDFSHFGRMPTPSPYPEASQDGIREAAVISCVGPALLRSSTPVESAAIAGGVPGLQRRGAFHQRR